MKSPITPTADTLLIDFVEKYYCPKRQVSQRSLETYRDFARHFEAALGRVAKVSDLPALARLKISKHAMPMLLVIWRAASNLRLVDFNDELPEALADLEIASYRLAMVRKNPGALIDDPRPDMPLLDFIMLHHMKTAHHRGKVAGGVGLLYKLRKLNKLLGDVLGRPPLVSDLTPQNRTLLKDSLRVSRASLIHVFDDVWLAVWRYAADLGLVAKENLPPERKPGIRAANKGPDGKAIKLEPLEGTLWNICLNSYFPINVRINKEATKKQYRFALRDFKQHLGHDPRPEDLTDDAVTGMMRGMIDRGLKPETVNERRGRIRALWEWMARKRMVPEFPFLQRVKEPKRIPLAWSRDELARLFEACRNAPGKMANGVLVADWWVALHLVLWDTGARIGEIIACQWDWLDMQTGQMVVPAEVRKGGDRDMAYRLHASTRAVLTRIRPLHHKLIFGEVDEQNLYYEYRKLKKRAGLPLGAKHGFHKMRRTVASWLQEAGYNASDVLKHSSPDLTRNSYLDPTIIGGVHPSEVLFRPDDETEPPRIGFAG